MTPARAAALVALVTFAAAMPSENQWAENQLAEVETQDPSDPASCGKYGMDCTGGGKGDKNECVYGLHCYCKQRGFVCSVSGLTSSECEPNESCKAGGAVTPDAPRADKVNKLSEMPSTTATPKLSLWESFKGNVMKTARAVNILSEEEYQTFHKAHKLKNGL